jgi:hypothetical protein
MFLRDRPTQTREQVSGLATPVTGTLQMPCAKHATPAALCPLTPLPRRHVLLIRACDRRPRPENSAAHRAALSGSRAPTTLGPHRVRQAHNPSVIPASPLLYRAPAAYLGLLVPSPPPQLLVNGILASGGGAQTAADKLEQQIAVNNGGAAAAASGPRRPGPGRRRGPGPAQAAARAPDSLSVRASESESTAAGARTGGPSTHGRGSGGPAVRWGRRQRARRRRGGLDAPVCAGTWRRRGWARARGYRHPPVSCVCVSLREGPPAPSLAVITGGALP